MELVLIVILIVGAGYAISWVLGALGEAAGEAAEKEIAPRFRRWRRESEEKREIRRLERQVRKKELEDRLRKDQ